MTKGLIKAKAKMIDNIRIAISFLKSTFLFGSK